MAIQDDDDAIFGLLTSCCFILREPVSVTSDCDDTLIDRLLHDVDVIIPFFFFCFFCAFCFLEGPSNIATSALSVPVGGGGKLLFPLSRELRLWKADDADEGACNERLL